MLLVESPAETLQTAELSGRSGSESSDLRATKRARSILEQSGRFASDFTKSHVNYPLLYNQRRLETYSKTCIMAGSLKVAFNIV